MKRIHIGLSVADLEESIAFYSTLFGCPPDVREEDYAKWMPDDPYVNLSITARSDEPPGTAHFGIQVDSPEDLSTISERLDSAGEKTIDSGAVECCYHKSEKVWVIDPDANRWETFYTTGRVTEYGENEQDLKEAHDARIAEIEAASGP